MLATPTPVNAIACYGERFPDGAGCIQVAGTPPGNGKFLFGGDVFGHRTVDFQATKEFELGNDVKLSARLNLLNAFNFKNYTSYTYDYGSGGVFNPNFVEINEDGDIAYVPRTLSFELGLKF